jgi:hypothetical protein
MWDSGIIYQKDLLDSIGSFDTFNVTIFNKISLMTPSRSICAVKTWI